MPPETLLHIRSLAGSITGAHESSFRNRQGLRKAALDDMQRSSHSPIPRRMCTRMWKQPGFPSPWIAFGQRRSWTDHDLPQTPRSTSARHMSSPFAEDERSDHPLKNTAVCAENLVRLM